MPSIFLCVLFLIAGFLACRNEPSRCEECLLRHTLPLAYRLTLFPALIFALSLSTSVLFFATPYSLTTFPTLTLVLILPLTLNQPLERGPSPRPAAGRAGPAAGAGVGAAEAERGRRGPPQERAATPGGGLGCGQVIGLCCATNICWFVCVCACLCRPRPSHR